MATVRMKKGTLYADIFDSPETIKQAQREGYSIVEKTFEKPKEEEAEPKAETSEKKNKRQ